MPEIYELEGPLLLLAGPGTGKTYNLAKRIKHLVEVVGISPEEISVITFTAAAAGNMRMQISDTQQPETYVSPANRRFNICTMHGLGHRIIKEKVKDIGLSEDFYVASTDPTTSMLMGDASQIVGHPRQDGEQTSKCRQFGDCLEDDENNKCRICEKYTEILRACNAIDHNDQVILAFQFLQKDTSLRNKYQAMTRHLLVDEYQDINAGQFNLIRILTEGQTEGLFAVGDDDQSIYSWRGGSPRFIRDFEGDFGKGAKVVPLNNSRRCHRNIMEGALAVVRAFDKDRIEKGDLSYECEEALKIVVYDEPSDKKEATTIKSIVKDALPSKDVLILIPHRGYASLIVEQLQRARIPYTASEALPGEGLQIIARLATWLKNEEDNIALRECIETMLKSRHLKVPSDRAKKEETKAQREEAFLLVSRLWERVIGEGITLWISLEEAHAEDELLGSIYCHLSDIRKNVRKDIPSFLQSISLSLEPWKKVDSLLEEVLGWIDKEGEQPRVGVPGIVRIMTMHGAKGLQSDVVCVVGLEEETFTPGSMNEAELAEKSRLMFVSMTRAKQDLCLFHARGRSAAVSFHSVHSKGGSHKHDPSRFIKVLPKECIERRYIKS